MDIENQKNNPFDPGIDLLLDYQEGLVDADTAARIEDVLNNSEMHRDMMAGIRSLYSEYEGDREKVEKMLSGFETIATPSILKYILSKYRTQGITTVALVILILILSFSLTFIFRRSDPIQVILNDELNHPREMLITERNPDSDSSLDQSWQNANDLYQEKAFSSTADTLRMLIDKGEDTDMAHLYLGICCLAQENPDIKCAVDQLTPISNGNGKYQEHAYWYLAIVHLLNDDETQAILILTDIVGRDEGHFRQLKSKKILDILD